jgi:hypothetical protein
MKIGHAMGLKKKRSDSSLLGCDAVSPNKYVPTFQRNMSPNLQGFKIHKEHQLESSSEDK